MSSMRVDSGQGPEVKPRPSWLKALGNESPPASIEIDGQTFHLVELYKHDSWAATSLYSSAAGMQRIVKMHRRSALLGVPMGWLGRLAARHERRLLEILSEVPGIPALAGNVTIAGRLVKNALAREFIAGHPLGDHEAVSDSFFHELAALVRSMHSRRVIYVDLHKRENIVVGAAGKPYLIDFQISLYWPRWLPRWSLFELMRRSDEYHLMKHWSRCRPDQSGLDYQAVHRQRPWWIKAHRLIARPIRELRRRLLVAVGVRTGKGRVESELFAEHALRADGPQRASRPRSTTSGRLRPNEGRSARS
jgi:hypothetical protein